MLLRLRIKNFKNLVDTDVRFGPFTCVAGANASGKSNLFDAIGFLSALADNTLIDAALMVRGEEHSANVRDLFHRAGDWYADEMSFEAWMIVPEEGSDDLGQPATAKTTFLRYRVKIAYRQTEGLPAIGSLQLVEELLDRVKLGDAKQEILFDHRRDWRTSVLRGRSTTAFVSTEEQNEDRIVKLFQDGTGGRPRQFIASKLPRTVLSTVNAIESPTALLARREMQSWRLLQLDPAALRRPDSFVTPPGMGTDGSGLASTLYHLAHAQERPGNGQPAREPARLYHEVASRLRDLIDDVYEISVDRDERRESLTVQVKDRSGTVYPARALSDGTLRFLALAVLEQDPDFRGLICFEEPENGIHPERIPAVLDILQDIAVDTDKPVGPDNPLRQVIINTHSPAVVQQVPEDALLVAEIKEGCKDGMRFGEARFSPLPGTWRHVGDVLPVPKGRLLAYLNPTSLSEPVDRQDERPSPRRVIDREDLRQLVLPIEELAP